jgi:signal peptidase I
VTTATIRRIPGIWGFVPDENIVGRAFFVWMNFGNLGRIGSFH